MSVDAPDAPLDLFSIEVALDPLLTGFTTLLGGRADLAPPQHDPCRSGHRSARRKDQHNMPIETDQHVANDP
ncbi:hypothetical protein [Nocardia sp. NPDC051832]|uniref:hypothetical protein n=1 Tax=Nocardia sp. NPDC051832 TaxID=3155673 RepID=UPI00342CE068